MSQVKVDALAPVGNLFLAVEDTETTKVLRIALDLLERCPEIETRIGEDQDRLARRKKKLRLEQKEWEASATPDLLHLALRDEIDADGLRLGPGRPRLPADLVYVFLMLRGRHGSVTDLDAIERLRDSVTVQVYLRNRALKVPGATTILENVNAVSNETREFILDAQLGLIREKGLDDFTRLTVDSTAADANSAWPTDAGMLYGLLSRAYHNLGRLALLGLPELKPWHCGKWQRQMKGLVFQINTAKGERQRQKLYRQLLDRAGRMATYLTLQCQNVFRPAKAAAALAPRLGERLERLWERIERDLADAERVRQYTRARVLDGQSIPSTEKVLSLADAVAAFIQKGGREAVLGYKPQVGRSGNGFVSALILEAGNPADAVELVPMVLQSQARTGVLPPRVITDDGYTSSLGRECLLYLGVEEVVFSGAKGKKITPTADWEAAAGRQARNGRSAVESLIFTLKFVHEFGRLRRRGLEAVRAEMLEKVIAYNFRRMVQVRESQAKAGQRQPAAQTA